MKILWYTRVFFPDLSLELNKNKMVVGGWTYSLANNLIKEDIELHVVTTSPEFEDLDKKINGINYHVLNSKKSILYYDKSLEQKFKKLISTVKPDVIHIHGTEHAHGLALMRSCPNENFVVSIQGLVGVIAKHYFGGIKFIDIVKNITFRDLIKGDTIFQQRKKFSKRGVLEIEYIKRTQNILGRTSWDFSHSRAINPQSIYHTCNRIFRSSFYNSNKWDLEKIEKYTIFLSQAGYPIKGLHKVIEAVSLLKEDFPTITIRVGGNNITKNDTFRDRLKLKGYGKYLKGLLKKYKLEDDVLFLGSMDENDMIKEYLKAHVFICPSSIENSPNSLGEAQLLGTPAIASYVGGVADMVEDGKTGLLYRFEEIELLAQHIKKIFLNDDLAVSLSKNGIEVAETRHSNKYNNNAIIKAYNLMCSTKKYRDRK